MPHLVNALRRMIRRAAPAAWAAALACAPTGDVRVLADSSAAPGAVEVAALRADPRSTAQRAADSLAALFERERATLNARTESLAATDRRSPQYAAAYAEHSGRAAAAETLRSARDGARRAAEKRPPLASDEAGEMVRAPLVRGATELRLRAGYWWIAWLDSAGGVITARRVIVRAGHVDTVRKSTVNSRGAVNSE